jgi:tetratricopeptide (TPR) repeat protein
LNAEEGDSEAAFEAWCRAVQLDEDLYREAALLCIQSLGQPERALELVGDNTGRLIWLAGALDALRVDPELTKQTHQKISDLLEQKCQEPQAPADVFACLAAIRQRQGRLGEAVKLYRQALASNFGRSDWHLSLATVLVATGSTAEAVEEAKTCLRLQPQYPAAHRFIEGLSSGAGLPPPGARFP